MSLDLGPFHGAAMRVSTRYARRYGPHLANLRADSTTIKDRWYHRHNCHIVRVRLGGATR